VHVFGPRAALLDALETAGFTPGLHPRRTPLGSLPAIRDLLLEGFNAG
jgi:hypothetical protein